MLDPLLECRNLSCGYGTHAVLHDICFAVQPGETVVLLGPNGSGKSTLLKSISKNLQCSQGNIYLSGKELSELNHREAAKRVAFVPQEENFKFEFTVREVVTMGRLPVSDSLWDTPEDILAATAAMGEADCLHLENRSILELSGGEKQRALIARAIVHGAPLLLFDEPTSHLDVEHQMGVSKLLRRLARQGTATVTAIHDLNLAQLVADRAILLQGGKVGMDASIEEVLQSPLLDEVYKVQFTRIRLESGRLAVFPDAPFIL